MVRLDLADFYFAAQENKGTVIGYYEMTFGQGKVAEFYGDNRKI